VRRKGREAGAACCQAPARPEGTAHQQDAINQLPDEEEGVGGLIALDRDGKHAFAMSKKSVGMYRGYVTEDGKIFVAILRAAQVKRVQEPQRKNK
jgi:hypothetical protein